MFYRLKSNACTVYKIPIRPILPIDQQFLFQKLIFQPVHKNSNTLSSYFVHQNWQMLQLKKLHCLPRFEPSALLFSAAHSNSFSVVNEVDHVPPTKATIVTVLIKHLRGVGTLQQLQYLWNCNFMSASITFQFTWPTHQRVSRHWAFFSGRGLKVTSKFWLFDQSLHSV